MTSDTGGGNSLPRKFLPQIRNYVVAEAALSAHNKAGEIARTLAFLGAMHE